jgi:hypothetical protein
VLPGRGATVSNPSAAITAGSGTGITVNDGASLRTQVYKISLAKEAFTANGTTQDVTLATLPAKTFLVSVIADVVTPFVCGPATCTTATLSATVGKSAGANEYLLSFDVDAAAAQFGDADGELGASLAKATLPTAIGDLGNWSTTQAIVLRATSGAGNWGNGTATNLTAGAVTVYLVTTRFP